MKLKNFGTPNIDKYNAIEDDPNIKPIKHLEEKLNEAKIV